MNKVIQFLAGSVLSLMATAQSTTPTQFPKLAGNTLQTTYMANLVSQPVRPMDQANLSGSPYLNENFTSGFVRIKNGYAKHDVPLRFNLYQNALEFKQGEVVLELDSLDMAIYLDTPGDSSTMHVLKTGYPPIDKQDERSIYEVLSMSDKAHLLKYKIQKIEDIKSVGEYGKKEIVTISHYYVYIPNNGIFKIKPNASSLTALFPSEEAQIHKIIKNKKLNLKKEADLVKLMAELSGAGV